MEVRTRKTRTLKVTELTLTAEDRRNLAELHQDPRYASLLNVMERVCIELETAHFNTPVGDVETILGGHVMTKSAWLFFQFVQKMVLNCYNSREQEPEPEAAPSLEEMLQGVEGFPLQEQP
jgi:hypothetical protein